MTTPEEMGRIVYDALKAPHDPPWEEAEHGDRVECIAAAEAVDRQSRAEERSFLAKALRLASEHTQREDARAGLALAAGVVEARGSLFVEAREVR